MSYNYYDIPISAFCQKLFNQGTKATLVKRVWWARLCLQSCLDLIRRNMGHIISLLSTDDLVPF